MMDEHRYLQLADDVFKRVIDLFEDVDGDDADVEPKGDVVTIRFRDRSRLVLNTQRPVRQIWVAGQQRAWHFGYDEASQTWLDDKGQGEELFAVIRRVARAAGVDLAG